MKSENINNYLLVNTTNQFLLECVPLCENSCYHLTNFSGDTGDALVCPDGKIKLFVDGRYHAQADNEVDKTKVDVIKLKLGEKQDDLICLNIKPNSILTIVGKKVSQNRYEYLKKLLEAINVRVEISDTDIYEQPITDEIKSAEIIPVDLSGVSSSDKFKNLQNPFITTNSEEVSYLCNLRDFNQDYTAKIDGKLVITNDDVILYTDYKIPKTDLFKQKKLNEFYTDIKDFEETFFLDKASISAYDYSVINKKKNITSPIKLMKSIKNETELEHYKYCFKQTDKALLAIRNYIENNDNLSEADISKELEEQFKNYGAKSLSFKSIVARNQNSALAHYSKCSENEILKDGDLVLIDCGAYYDGGLATDITRVFVKGKATDEIKKVYTTVLKMFLNAFNYQVIEGVTTGFEIDKYTRLYLDKNNIDDFSFSHGLGHGIGVYVHEAPPNLSMNEVAKTPLKNNMCFTIEPGLYNKNKFGIRLENSCYLKNGEIKSFSNMCYEKKMINYDMMTEQEKEWLKEFEVL